MLTFYRDPAAPVPAAHYTTHYKMVEHGKPLFQKHHSAHNTTSYSSCHSGLSTALYASMAPRACQRHQIYSPEAQSALFSCLVNQRCTLLKWAPVHSIMHIICIRRSVRLSLHISPKTSESHIGPRVEKMVLNTQC